MRRCKTTLALFVLALFAVCVPASLAGQQQRAASTTPRCARPADRRRVAHLRPDQSETRFSPLTDINATNVARLGLAWSYDVGAGGGGQEATPLVWNGTIYGITNWSVVFAVDARTGKEKWRWDP